MYIIILLIILICTIYLIKKVRNPFKIKDYSSEKLQNRTFFKDVGGFTFNDKTLSKEQIKHDTKILQNLLNNAESMNKEKKKWLKKLIKAIKQKRISFQNLNYENAINVINLSTDDIADLVLCNKSSILVKVFPFFDENYELTPEKLQIAKLHGINEDELQKWVSELIAKNFIYNGFINDDQYEILYEQLKISDVNNPEDIKKLSQKLFEIINNEQKKDIEDNKVDYEVLAKYLLYYGKNCIFRVSKLKKILPESFFDEINKDSLSRILKGIDIIKKDDFSIIENVNFKIVNEDFEPTEKNDNKITKALKNISYINAFKDHDQILDSLTNAEQRYLKIPQILVNFDAHSDIHIDKRISEQTIANWVNIAIKKCNLKKIYWVVPEIGLFDAFCFRHYFGEDNAQNENFIGKFDINKVYKDLKKPLIQRFLFDTSTMVIISESANYSDKEFNSYLQTGKYKKVIIQICTASNLPKLNKDFILSIDADYFNLCGFDSAPWLEQISFNQRKIYNDFLELYYKKLSNASITGLCISPEYIGFDALGSIRGFYEYLLKKVKEINNK